MDQTKLNVQIFYGLHQLFEDCRCLILLQKSIFFCVLKEVALAEEFSDNVYSCFGVVVTKKSDNAGMMTKLENAFLEFDDLFLVLREFELFNDFDCNFLTGTFLDSPIDRAEVASSNFFHDLILIIDAIFFKLI
jgi:hypothetical protein